MTLASQVGKWISMPQRVDGRLTTVGHALAKAAAGSRVPAAQYAGAVADPYGWFSSPTKLSLEVNTRAHWGHPGLVENHLVPAGIVEVAYVVGVAGHGSALYRVAQGRLEECRAAFALFDMGTR